MSPLRHSLVNLTSFCFLLIVLLCMASEAAGSPPLSILTAPNGEMIPMSEVRALLPKNLHGELTIRVYSFDREARVIRGPAGFELRLTDLKTTTPVTLDAKVHIEIDGKEYTKRRPVVHIMSGNGYSIAVKTRHDDGDDEIISVTGPGMNLHPVGRDVLVNIKQMQKRLYKDVRKAS